MKTALVVAIATLNVAALAQPVQLAAPNSGPASAPVAQASAPALRVAPAANVAPVVHAAQIAAPAVHVTPTLPPPPGTLIPKLAPAAAQVHTAATAKSTAPAVDNRLVQKVAAQPLPGLGTMPGERELTSAKPVRVQSDRNEIVYVSGSMANRIATPFDSPKVIDTKDVEYQTIGQSIYLIPNDPDKPVALYITGSNPNDPVVSLTLVPKAIPQQTILLQLDAPLAKSATTDSEPPPASDAYSDRIRYVLRQLALSKTPDGFVEGSLPAATAVLKGVTVTPMARYSGPAYDVYRYRIKGTSTTDVELSEEAFFSQGVRAVAFFPTAVLRKDDQTTVFVIADKSATEN